MTRYLMVAGLTAVLVLGGSVQSGAMVLGAAGQSSVSLFHFDGWIDYHNDVVYSYFSLADDANDVRIWTDSFESGANFDPITALWRASDGYLLGQNDDNPYINPGTQTYWDSGMEFSTLAAGDYIFTIASYDNFASGNYLSDGFYYDGAQPIPIEQWWVYGEGYWSLWLEGVDTAEVPGDDEPEDPGQPVPEPTTLLLFGLGLPLVSRFRRRTR